MDLTYLERYSGHVAGERLEEPIGRTPLGPDDPDRQAERDGGVDVRRLAPGTTLLVVTRHSRYRLRILDGRSQRALVSGGSLLPACTEARIEGATGEGAALKVGCVAAGLQLELYVGGRRIRTSSVVSVDVEQ
jgi:hypothetical protein